MLRRVGRAVRANHREPARAVARIGGVDTNNHSEPARAVVAAAIRLAIILIGVD